MAGVNFHGIFGDSHTVADPGGDIVNEFELEMRYISDLGDWYVPANDLYNIYLDMYGEVRINKSEIIECSTVMFLGRLGEQLAISLLYGNYYDKSTFLTDRLNDYFLGGVDDMATVISIIIFNYGKKINLNVICLFILKWTQLTWNKVLFMLENGVE